MNPAHVNMDAFANGQIESKLWLCEELERLSSQITTVPEPVVWLLGGWYGMTAFLLRTRDRMKIGSIRSFDMDPEANRIADLINNTWEMRQWEFKAMTQDCNDPGLFSFAGAEAQLPQIVINTACEHFERQTWWHLIPSGTGVVLQSTDQVHSDEKVTKNWNLETMRSAFQPMKTVLYEGEKEFRYPNRSFRRFMLIGIKGR